MSDRFANKARRRQDAILPVRFKRYYSDVQFRMRNILREARINKLIKRENKSSKFHLDMGQPPQGTEELLGCSAASVLSQST